jgi:hypothetical protein
MTVRLFSFGGGVQSVAALVLAAQERIDFPLFVFADVGEDSENPTTVAYVHDVAEPFARDHGIEFVTVAHRRTLLSALTAESRSIVIPVRMSNGAPGNRRCTFEWKMRPVAAEAKRRGATRVAPAVVGLGISVDEVHRARTDSGIPHETLAYPLLDLRMTRNDCADVIRSAGLPVPPKSACWFCPFHRPSTWADMRRETPDLFSAACDLEAGLNRRRAMLNKDDVWFTRFARPLGEAIDGNQEAFGWGDEMCESGYCWT